MRGRAAAGFGLVACLFVLVACAHERRNDAEQLALPEAAELAEAFNTRIEGLDRLWARAVTSLTYRDAEGRPAREQGDGHFMFVAPDRVAHTIGGPDRTYIHFGSGSLGDGTSGGWLIDAVDEPVAYVVPEEADASITVQGIRIDPKRFLVLAGLRPIDPAAATIRRGSASDTAWLDVEDAAGGLLSLEVRLGSGEPVRVEARDRAGELLLGSVLSDPIRVSIRGGGRTPPVIPSRIEVTVPGDVEEPGEEGAAGSVRLSLSDPEINPRRPNQRIFDLGVLKKTYGVDEVIDVTRPTPEAQDRSVSGADG